MKDKNNKNLVSQINDNQVLKILLSGLGVGLYPTLYFFSRKPDILTSWSHYAFFGVTFIAIPIIIFLVIQKWIPFKKSLVKNKIHTFFSVSLFFFFLQLILFTQHHKKLTLLAIVLGFIIAHFLWKHIAKIILLQLILAILTLPLIYKAVQLRNSYSTTWMQQEDNIEDAVFKKKPNIYFIEPDGYVNFSELNKGFYKIENREFEQYLDQRGFVAYPNFRSNYPTTLASNASFFSMKHHFFNKDLKSEEVQFARDIIFNTNPVLEILKKNNYTTNYITDTPYLLSNRPKMKYDATNYGFWDVSFIDNGIRDQRANVLEDFKRLRIINDERPSFFFIQYLEPWHIHTREIGSAGKEKEREMYRDRLYDSNAKMQQIIDIILENDKEALIVMMADHGGYVGMDHGQMAYTKSTDRDLVHSIFSTILAIHWPNDDNPSFATETGSSVNLFRMLISYLSEEPKYLDHLQDNSSYIILKEGVEHGIYQYIDNFGNVTCKPVSSKKDN